MAVKAKLDPNARIQKRRSADEMRAALYAFSSGKPERSIPPQMDDSDIILSDAIEELLEARALLAEMQGFLSQWQLKVSRR